MFRYLALVWLAVFSLAAAEHHGQVMFSGLPVPGVAVTATQGDKRLSAVTDQQGVYTFPDLSEGTWKVRVEMLCFEPIEREIAVAANAPAGLWELKMLPMAELTAHAPVPAATPVAPTPSVAVATPPPGKGKSKGKKQAAGTPQQADAGFQRAGLKASTDAAKLDESDTSEVKQSAADGLLINGSVNNGAASPFGQAAAFGNNRRGMRSLYNGGLGWIVGNSALDARPYSLTGQDTARPSYNHVMGVASFGGPIKIPHLVRDGPNVFVNYQWMRNRTATTEPSLMPDAQQRAGVFSTPVIDPLNGAPFPGNVIPQNRISPQAAALLRFYPLPNFESGTGYNYQVPLLGSTHQDSLQSRWNKGVGRRNQLSGSFAFQSVRSDSPSIFGFNDTASSLGMNTTVNWMHRYTQRVFQNINVQFSRQATRTTPFFANRENVSGEAGITGNNQEAVNWGPPSLVFASGIAGLTDAESSTTRNQTSGITYSLMWVRNSHTFTFGGDFRRQEFNLLAQQNPRGTFTFIGSAAGSDFAGFLLGIPDTSAIAFGNADKYFRDSIYDAYFTDDWRVGPGLTLNLGMRWDYGSPITERYGRLVNLDVANGFSAVAPIRADSPTGSLTGTRYPNSLVAPDKHAFEPRVAFAWHPLLASSLIIRGGYGIYYDTSVYLSIAEQMAQQSPLSKSLSVANSAKNPLSLENGFYAPALTTTNTFGVDPNFRVGYSQNWQLSVQRDLKGGLVATATYQGSKGTRARQEFLPNTWPTGVTIPCPACPSGFIYETSNGNSTREAGVFQLRRRLRSGFTASLQYTFSKSIDNGALGGRGQGGQVIAQDWLNLSAERGLSPFDQRHLVNATVQYSTGMGLAGGTMLGGWRGALSKDWTFITQITAGSGFPLTPVYLSPVQGTGVTGPIRPDYTGADIYDAPDGLHLNPQAVARPVSGQWGNAGRNSITGPSQFTLNASMSRTFRLGDHWNADFRIDATNALNHVTYPSWLTIWTANIPNPQFGLPATANAMRTVRTSFRVRF